jgi:type III pantothenate kinase
MLKLVADIGNTRHKLHIFNDKELIHTDIHYGVVDEALLRNLFSRFGTPKAAIVSSVVEGELLFLPYLLKHCRVLGFGTDTPLPIANGYGTPETLGQDRLAAAVGGGVLFPGIPVLVIEAGTCIKYELVANNEYLGGIIAPGIGMMARALHTFTGKLPLVHPDPGDMVPLTGSTTESALLSGIINVAAAAMNDIVGQYSAAWPGLRIVLGGGDMNYFDKRLKYSIFAARNIVALGLNEILDFNENNTEVWISADSAAGDDTAAQGAVAL